MLLVYTHKITSRVTYIFKHICTRRLGLAISFTSKVEDFVAHDGPKLSYTLKQLGNELHIKSSDLLFEQGIYDADIKVSDWDEVPCFFAIREAEAPLPYDIFAASFYLLSRYEEYLPHVKDEFGRYPHSESLAATSNFLKTPVVDIWIQRFEQLLESTFSDLDLRRAHYETHIVLDILQAFKFRKLGFLRAVGGFFRDVYRLRFRENLMRIRVLLSLRRDPYDTFGWIINMQKQSTKPFHVFFQLGDYGDKSKNIKYSKRSFQTLFKMVADYCETGLLVSSQAAATITPLMVERKRYEDIGHRPLERVRLSDNRINVPHAYRALIDQEINEDYTMGYPDTAGFRAGTSCPFLFYDLDYEIQTPLMIHSVCLNGDDIINEKNHTIDFVGLQEIQRTVRNVNGDFIVRFSNASLESVYCKKLFRALVLNEI